MDKVYLVFRVWFYSEEDHGIYVERVFRSKDDANIYCSSLIDSNNDDFIHFFVESYDVF